MADIFRKTNNATVALQTDDPLEFVMSDGTPDRDGDVIDPGGWDTKEFEGNPIALMNHDYNFVIGNWQNVRVTNNQLRGHLKLVPPGTSSRLDEARRLLLGGVYRAVSVGFLPLAHKPRPSGGKHYTRAKLIECSAVAVPSNPAALRMEAKALGVSEATIKALIDRPPQNASIAQRAAFARASLKGKAEADAQYRRICAKVRADQAKKQALIDEEAERFRKGYMACRTEDARIAFLIADKRKTEERIAKARDASTKRRVAENQRKLGGMISLAKNWRDSGVDPQDIMKEYLANIAPKRWDY